MKKYTLFLLVSILTLSLFGLFGVTTNFASADDSACMPGDLFNRTTGQACSHTTAPECKAGDLFSSVTGKPCPVENTTWCHTFNTNLGVGSSGDEVNTLLGILVKEGVAFERSSNFGNSFDETLASAVSAFQEKYKSEILAPVGLRAGTGYLGARTRAKLNALYGCSKPQSSVVISGVSGPQSLDVNQQGTWTVTAYDKNGGNLSYVVVWGDEVYASRGLGSLVQQSATFTHSYSQAGVYTPKFEVISNGQSAQTSLSVNVGNVSNSSSITVLSPNGGEAWTQGSTQTIKWQDNTPYPPCPANAGCLRAQRVYDISLVPFYPPCTSKFCPMYVYRTPYLIAKGVTGSSYKWSVGQYDWGNLSSNQGAPAPIYDGIYMIEVCQMGTDVCDSSDSYFKIYSN